jgi:hypothetical protein
LIEPRDHGADPGVFRPHTVAESPSSAPVPGFADIAATTPFYVAKSFKRLG